MSVRTEGPFPRLALRDLEGRLRPLEETWSAGDALLLIGHGDCGTTLRALPFVDRIHGRRAPGRNVLLILQDDAETARGLVEELRLGTPVRLEEDPFPLARELGLETVPTLVLVGGDGLIAGVSEAFNRADIEALAEAMGVSLPLFTPEDQAPQFRPG